ncbi:MAG: sugar ABC transporter ATP-binding protein [Paracoccaceae bacterium]
MEPILRLEKVTKAYRSVPAIQDVDFDLRKGEIHALLGENGAGKSTLTKVMAGVVEPTSGRMIYKGRETTFANPNEALHSGVAMVFQETSLVPSMTVAQNLYLGSERFLNRLRGTFISAQQFLQSLNFPVDPGAMVESLGAAKRQMVEIARAVHHKSEVIIFDEPTATLTPEEKRHFFALLRRLRERGVSIVFISHALEEALMIADRITILRDGELVTTGPTADFDRDKIIAAMVGRTLSGELYRKRDASHLRKPGRKVLSVQDISMGAMVRNTSFSIFEGQITGVFGLIGSGRTETFKIISGIYKRDFLRGGQITLDDRPVRYYTPAQAVSDGICYITEDRNPKVSSRR